MGEDVQYCEIPDIWPKSLSPFSNNEIFYTAPWVVDFPNINCLFGTTYDVEESGINWLEYLLRRSKFQCRLILLLYPACATRKEHLNRMLDLTNIYGNCFEIRLLPFNIQPITVISFASGDEWDSLSMAVGAAPNLGVKTNSPGVINILYHPDRVLHERWCRWFDQLWDNSVPLTHDSAAIPDLVKAKGSSEALQMWADYVQGCCTLIDNARQGMFSKEEKTDSFTEFPNLKPECSPPSVTEELGIPRLNLWENRITDLYQKGVLVSVDKVSRIPPLEIPIKPDWFEIESFKRVGAVSRQISYRVSVFTEEEVRKIRTKQNAIGDLLRRFSFSLADGQRWMPNSARLIFEKEIERINCEGIELLQKTITGNIIDFIETRKDRILADAAKMYQEFHPGRSLPGNLWENISEAIKQRLNKLNNERILPLVSYTEICFLPEKGSKFSSPWPQALRLIKNIAEFPRKAITEYYFFFRGLKVPEKEYIRAMDVCKDCIVNMWMENKKNDLIPSEKIIKRALNELEFIQKISSYSDDKAKCMALLALIDGWNHDDIIDILETSQTDNT